MGYTSSVRTVAVYVRTIAAFVWAVYAARLDVEPLHRLLQPLCVQLSPWYGMFSLYVG